MQDMIAVDDKVLHCISRIIQEGMSGHTTKCLYCKYAPECRHEFETTGNVLFIDILRELREKTSVDIALEPETMQKNILHGSWLEDYPELLREFTNMSFDEQPDNLRHPDILNHLHNLIV